MSRLNTTSTALWRSKLRRIQRLGAWRQCIASRSACNEYEEVTRCAPAQKRRRAASAGDGAHQDRPFLPASRTSRRRLRRQLERQRERQLRRQSRRLARARARVEAPTAEVPVEPEPAEDSNTPKAVLPPQTSESKRRRSPGRDAGCDTLALAVTLRDAAQKSTGPRVNKKAKTATPTPPLAPPPPPPSAPADPASQIRRILDAQTPEDTLGLGIGELASEEAVAKAWKRLVLVLHPDKLHGLDEDTRQAGIEALNFVHMAKEELRRRSQEQCAEVPPEPAQARPPRLLESASGLRKYEVSWCLPEKQDPLRPIEKYEIWGPRYFTEAGDGYDHVLLATLPPLQSHFVLVEEAPTQQDVMWAADRVLRRTLPLTLHAANGKGLSGPLTFDLPWSTIFPWLQGAPSVLCPQCLRLSPRRNGWSRCGGCGYNVPPEAIIIVRCPECNGEALWNKNNALNCSCCMIRLGQAHDVGPPQYQRPKPPRGPAQQHKDYYSGPPKVHW